MNSLDDNHWQEIIIAIHVSCSFHFTVLLSRFFDAGSPSKPSHAASHNQPCHAASPPLSHLKPLQPSKSCLCRQASPLLQYFTGSIASAEFPAFAGKTTEFKTQI